MRVCLYTSADCGLCDAWKFEILDLQAELGFEYEELPVAAAPLGPDVDPRAVPIVAVETTAGGVSTAETHWLYPPLDQPGLRRRIREAAGREAGPGEKETFDHTASP